MANQTQDKRTWLGVIFLAIGAFLILHKLDIVPFIMPHYLFSWKVLLIALGGFFIIERKKKDAGIILMVIGSVFLFKDIGFFNIFDVFHYLGFWSLLFIGLGAAILLKKANPESKSN